MSGAGPDASRRGLAALLAGRVPAGTYRCPDGLDDAEVAQAVERAGWRHARLVGQEIGTKPELLDALRVALDLRGLHGGNLDALEECLRTLPGPTVLLWDDWGVLAGADRRTFDAVTTLLSAPAAPRRSQGPGPATWVLLRGAGPDDLDLPDLPDLPSDARG